MRPLFPAFVAGVLALASGCSSPAKPASSTPDGGTGGQGNTGGSGGAGAVTCGSSLADIMALGCAASLMKMEVDSCANPNERDAYRAGPCGDFLVFYSTAGFYGYSLACTYDLQGQLVGARLQLPETEAPCPTAGAPVYPGTCDLTMLPKICDADGGVNASD
jgi:hypothetical protein